MRTRKLVFFLSVAQILPEKINKMFLPKKLGFIDVLSTVSIKQVLIFPWAIKANNHMRQQSYGNSINYLSLYKVNMYVHNI